MYDCKLLCYVFFYLCGRKGARFFKMELTDLHCHILTAMDDGSPDLETSVAMAKMAYASGVTTIAATPHSNVEDDNMALRCRSIRHRAAMLQDALSQNRIPVKILTGMELFIRDNLPEIIESEGFMPLGKTNYLLGEFDFGEDGGYMDEALTYIMKSGINPVLAHPERYAAVQREPLWVARWFEKGVIIQVNKGSLLGRFGRGPHMAADWILRHGLAHIVASDAHGTERRTPDMTEVFDCISSNYSERYAEVLLSENPGLIAAGKPVLPPKER